MSARSSILKEPEPVSGRFQITPDLVPHAEFHTGIWLQSAERPGWYYFKKQPSHHQIENKDFSNSVDAPLKELVQLLHEKGIKTTPSCSGHHIRERDFKKIYSELVEDREIINTRGLTMKDIESGKLYFFKNGQYHLPWPEKEFLDRIHVYQQKGVLGLQLAGGEIKRRILDLKLDGVNVRERDGFVFIFTGEEKEVDIKKTWKEITEAIEAIFKEAE